jgi:DNA-directed RNA polymerase specialized sigma subunit
MDPVDDFLAEKDKTAAARDAEDMNLLGIWQKKPTKKNLGVLLKRFDPVFNAKVSTWKATAVPAAAFKADLQKNAITAFETYDPNRGAKLRTHVNNMLKRSLRFNSKYQNMAFIPEEKAALISPVQQARDQLHQEFGKKPTNKSVANYLNQNPDMLPKRVRGRMSSRLVKTVDAYQIADIPGEAFESDPVPRAMSFEQETLDLLRPALKGDERVVYDYMFGAHGKPKVPKTGEIAKRMGKSPSQISRLKRRIEATYKKYV